MSVLKDFFELKRYNIHEVTQQNYKPDSGNRETQGDVTGEKDESGTSHTSDKEDESKACMRDKEHLGLIEELNKNGTKEMQPPEECKGSVSEQLETKVSELPEKSKET